MQLVRSLLQSTTRPAATLFPRTRTFAPPSRSKATFSKSQKTTSLYVGGQFVTLDHVFLRDTCTCERCVHPSTKQKLFQTSDIPLLIKPRAIKPLDDQSIQIEWGNDVKTGGPEPHISVYSAEFLAANSAARRKPQQEYHKAARVLWDRQMLEPNNLWLEYEEYVREDASLFQALKQLARYGIVFLRNVPSGEGEVKRIAERIGNLKNTFYGPTWDVKSSQDSKNIAYTSLDLGLHMDLLYFESPPGLQFLHSIKNSTTGGTSVFADAFRAAEALRAVAPNQFQILTMYPVTYHYANDGQHYRYSRPTIELDELSSKKIKPIEYVNWSPPFQAPFQPDAEGSYQHWRQYLVAVKDFAETLEAEQNQFEMKLNEGECVVFDNRRIVHGRRAFDPSSGERWLKGAYVDIDAFRSRYRVLVDELRARHGSQAPLFDDTEYAFIR